MKYLTTILSLLICVSTFSQHYPAGNDTIIFPNVVSDIGVYQTGKVYVPNYSQQALALFNRMPVQPPDSIKTDIDNAIKRLVRNNLFDGKFDVLKVYAVHDSASALLNWIEDDHKSTPRGKSVRFTPFLGFTGKASDTSYLNYDYKPYYDHVNYSNINASIGSYVNSNVYEDHTFILGYSDGGVDSSATGVIWRYGSLQGKVNEGTSGQSDVTTSGRSSGFHVYTRTDTNTVVSYYNKYLQNSATRAADQTLLKSSFAEFVNPFDYNRRSDQTVSLSFVGDSLSSIEVDSLYSIFKDYLIAVGSYDSWGNDTMLAQGFEGTGYDNHTFTTVTGTTYPDYTTNPIMGSQSDSIPYGTNIRINLPLYTDTVNVFLRFRLSDATPASNSNIIQLRTSTTNVLYLQCQTSGVLKLGVGTPTQNATGSISSNTNYYCWLQYIVGTGADAKGYAYISTTSTKPASPTISITNGSSTAKPNNIYFAGVNAGGTVIDNVIVKRTIIQ